jgi:16S rRNA C967 or C1407 C5-methylase (RsmB/RsmF family)/NOL1/NOP2/fmu family ribosome biogenesis protein
MLPGDFIERLRTQNYIDSESLLKALEEPSPVSIRLNRGKWNNLPAGSEPVPWCRSGYYLRSRPSFTLDPLFHSGCYYPQEASSMFLEKVFLQLTSGRKNLRVLDLCGAPGGKSTHLSDLAGEDSLLISNEVIRSRASVLAETITKWGASNVIVTQNDPSAFNRLEGYFDIILADAPCSGEGMFRSRIAIDEWSAANTALCAERQKRIIQDVWPSLKENGVLIYSTCTFNPGENEQNIRWLTEKHNVESVVVDISDSKDITPIDFEGIHGYGFHPGKIKGEGFFISAIRKKEKQNEVIVRTRKKQEYLPGKNDIAVAEKISCFPGDRLLKRNDDLFSIPCSMEEYLFVYGILNVVKGGTLIATERKKDINPSHELSLSRKIRHEAYPHSEVNLSDAISFLRRDNFSITGMNEGWNILTYRNVNLGFVKNIGKRFNNYFPVEWRIRMVNPGAGKENIISWSE